MAAGEGRRAWRGVFGSLLPPTLRAELTWLQCLSGWCARYWHCAIRRPAFVRVPRNNMSVLPAALRQEVLHSYVHNHLRSDLIWAKAKLAVVTHLAKRLRAKLAAEQAARAQAGGGGRGRVSCYGNCCSWCAAVAAAAVGHKAVVEANER